MNVRANTLCLLGVAVGFVAMMSVWRFVFFATPLYIYDFPQARIETGFILFEDSLEQLHSLQMTTFYLGAMLAAVGVIIGFATPLGGAIEIAGACLYLSVTPSEQFVGGLHGTYYFLRIGPVIALISGSLMVLSLVLPIILNRGLPPDERWRILWTFAADRRDGPAAHGRGRLPKMRLASWGSIRSRRVRLVLSVAAVAALIASIGISLNDSYTKESTKIAVHVIVDTSDVAYVSIGVDERLTQFSGGGEVLRNYFVEAGEHNVRLTATRVTSPIQNQTTLDVYTLPLQTVVITVLITDVTWFVSTT